jgi:hypothetical protein
MNVVVYKIAIVNYNYMMPCEWERGLTTILTMVKIEGSRRPDLISGVRGSFRVNYLV